jgi:hypothetical protein
VPADYCLNRDFILVYPVSHPSPVKEPHDSKQKNPRFLDIYFSYPFDPFHSNQPRNQVCLCRDFFHLLFVLSFQPFFEQGFKCPVEIPLNQEGVEK